MSVKISVIGCGYLGAVLRRRLPNLGTTSSASTLTRGRSPFWTRARLRSSNLACSRSSSAAWSPDDFASARTLRPLRARQSTSLVWATPQRKGEHAADLQYVEATVEGLLPHLRPGDVVVGRSTVPAGTAGGLLELIQVAQPEATLVWNAEFLREGYEGTVLRLA